MSESHHGLRKRNFVEQQKLTMKLVTSRTAQFTNQNDWKGPWVKNRYIFKYFLKTIFHMKETQSFVSTFKNQLSIY